MILNEENTPCLPCFVSPWPWLWVSGAVWPLASGRRVPPLGRYHAPRSWPPKIRPRPTTSGIWMAASSPWTCPCWGPQPSRSVIQPRGRWGGDGTGGRWRDEPRQGPDGRGPNPRADPDARGRHRPPGGGAFYPQYCAAVVAVAPWRREAPCARGWGGEHVESTCASSWNRCVGPPGAAVWVLLPERYAVGYNAG